MFGWILIRKFLHIRLLTGWFKLVTYISTKGNNWTLTHGFYSNKSRGMRRKATLAEQVPLLIDTDIGGWGFL
jgi:hypothetical protein